MSNLYIMVGPSGSGKSTYTIDLRNYRAIDESDIILLSSDDFRAAISNVNDQTIHGMVFDWIRKSCSYFLSQNHDVIVDATCLNPSERASYIEIGKKYNSTIIAVFFSTSKEKCIQRNTNRDRVVPNYVIEKQFTKLVKPTLAEGFNKVLNITEDGYTQIV